MQVAIYCRVSTEDQAEAKTIKNQVDFAQKYCELNELTIYDFYLDEGVSGTIAVHQRPAGQRLMKDAQNKKFQIVFVYRLDRLARTTLDILHTHEQLKKWDIELRSMTESFDTSTPAGKFFMTTLGGIAEIERATIAERMRLGKARAVREGRWPGGPSPYGYRLENKRLVVNEEEAVVVKLIFDLYTQKNWHTVKIADYLTAAGYPSPSKKKNNSGVWHGSRVWAILVNPTYQGQFLYGKDKRRGQAKKICCPKIIQPKQWQEAQEIRRKNFFYASRRAKRTYLLRGLIRCGVCQRSYCGDGSDKKGRRCYYRCTGNSSFRGKLMNKCDNPSVRAEELEAVIWQDIFNYLRHNEKLLQYLFVKAEEDQEDRLATELTRRVKKDLRGKEQERERLITLYRKGILKEQELEKQLGAVTREVILLQQREKEFDSQIPVPKQKVAEESLEEKFKGLKHQILSAEHHLQRELLAVLIEEIIVQVGETEKGRVPLVQITYRF